MSNDPCLTAIDSDLSRKPHAWMFIQSSPWNAPLHEVGATGPTRTACASPKAKNTPICEGSRPHEGFAANIILHSITPKMRGLRGTPFDILGPERRPQARTRPDRRLRFIDVR